MKHFLFILAAAIMAAGTGCKNEKKSGSSGMPGDDLDLYAVLGLFKKSKSPADFEKMLNDKSNHVNNLDLNGDSAIDYIRVIDQKEGDDHAITLRVPLNDKESQDVAVIGIEKTGPQTARLQVIGDEDLYGKDYIVEPSQNVSPASFAFAGTLVVVNVWTWPLVSYIYEPDYVVYASPYYWGYYPEYWEPWTPVVYEEYYPEVYVYHTPTVVRVRENIVTHPYRIYTSHRVVSNFHEIRRENVARYQPRHGGGENPNGMRPGPRPIPPSVNPAHGERGIAPGRQPQPRESNAGMPGNQRREAHGEHGASRREYNRPAQPQRPVGNRTISPNGGAQRHGGGGGAGGGGFHPQPGPRPVPPSRPASPMPGGGGHMGGHGGGGRPR